MFKKILIGLFAVVMVFVIVVALQPSAFRIERTETIAATPAAVFAQVNDFHKWQAWSPWTKLDPNAKVTFEGPEAGEGAVFRWAGNDEVGEGHMTITDSRPNERIVLDLEFIKPFPDTAKTEFTFKPQGDQTAVTWAMSGESGFFQRAICIFMNLDKMVGGDFEKGLASMKRIVEAERQQSVAEVE